jgi:hypothetical protein
MEEIVFLSGRKRVSRGFGLKSRGRGVRVPDKMSAAQPLG